MERYYKENNYLYASPSLSHAGKKGSKWGYTKGRRNGKKTANIENDDLELRELEAMDAVDNASSTAGKSVASKGRDIQNLQSERLFYKTDAGKAKAKKRKKGKAYVSAKGNKKPKRSVSGITYAKQYGNKILSKYVTPNLKKLDKAAKPYVKAAKKEYKRLTR